jgi:hypothetical protein
MPNHVTNEITILGTLEQVKAVKDFVRSEENPFDFNKLAPIPKELRGTRSPMQHISQEEYDEQEKLIAELDAKINRGDKLTKEEQSKVTFGFSRQLTEELSRKYIKEFGTDNWYNWQIANWGTKWNSYSHFGLDDDGEPFFGFQTAWSHPLPIIEALSIKFPEVKFEVRFADEDFGYNVGSYEILGGLIENEFFPTGGSTEALMLATDIIGDDFYAYDMFVEMEEDVTISDLDEFEMNMLEFVVKGNMVDGDFPVGILEGALNIALDNELYEVASKVRDYIGKKVEK